MKISLLTSVCVGALVLSTAANSQDVTPQSVNASTGGLEDIVVTAQRREERLQDVPLAVTAIGSEQLRAQNINNVGDLGQGRVPGLSVNSNAGSETTFVLNMRGFGPNDAVQGTVEVPVALYIDGVPFSRTQGTSLDLITPERIEILRGPQGQLFGRNAEAGAVQIITRRPSGQLGAELSAGLGNFSQVQTRGRLDLPEFGGFKIQLSGNYRKHGGYYKNIRNPNLQNVTPGNNPLSTFHYPLMDFDKDLQRLKTYGARAAVEYDAGPFNLYYSFDFNKTRDDQGYSTLGSSPDRGTIFNPNSASGPMSYTTRAGPGATQLIFSYPEFNGKMPKSVPFSLPSMPFYTKSNGHMLNLTLDAADGLTLRSISGTRYVRRQGISATPNTNQLLPTTLEYMRSRTYSQEFQAIYDTDNFNITAGAMYFHERVKDERESLFSLNCATAPVGPCTANGFPTRIGWALSAASGGFKRSFSRANVFGLYAQASYTPDILDRRLELTGGLRYSNDEKNGFRPIDFGLSPITGVVALRNRFKTDRVDPAFTAKYKVADDVNVYGRYAVGYRSGGSSVRSPTFQPFDEEVMTSYELGFKSQFLDHRVRLNLAGFFNTVKGQQVSLQSDPSLNPGLTDFFNNPHRRKIKGFEVELSARPTSGLTLSGTFTHLDVNIVAFGLDRVVAGTRPTAFAVNGTWSPTTGLIPDAATVAAHPNSTMVLSLPQAAPKNAGSIALDYALPISTGRLTFHADWTISSLQYTTAPYKYVTLVTTTAGVTSVRPQPRYVSGDKSSRVNASVAFKNPLAGSAEAELRLWVKNLMNRADRTYAFAAGNAISASTPYPNSVSFLMPPRTFGADLTIRY